MTTQFEDNNVEEVFIRLVLAATFVLSTFAFQLANNCGRPNLPAELSLDILGDGQTVIS
jgi:hypothetical protein